MKKYLLLYGLLGLIVSCKEKNMGMDIYTGSFTRYYAGLWENQFQVMCRESGQEYTRVTPSDDSQSQDERMTSEEILESVQGWMTHLSQDLGLDLNWNEGVEIPYYTLQYSESAEVSALSSYATVFGSDTPDHFPEEIDFRKDKILKRDPENERFDFLGQVEVFLPTPLPESGIYVFQLMTQNKAYCSSTQKLLEEIDGLSQKIWNVSVSYLDSLPEENVYNEYAKKKVSLALAIFGLCKLYRSALFSQQNNVPILLDY